MANFLVFVILMQHVDKTIKIATTMGEMEFIIIIKQ